MALYHKWNVKNDFAYVFTFFSLISDSLGSVEHSQNISIQESNHTYAILKHIGHFCHVPLYSGNPISREWSMFMCTIYCSQRYSFMFSGEGEKIPGKKVYS